MIKANNPSYHELQIWCSDMWAVLWGGWRLGHETRCLPEFDFSWGTPSEIDYHKMNIMHNAGVTGESNGLFYKAGYQNEFPYGKELDIKTETASWHYWDWVKKTAEKSVLI